MPGCQMSVRSSMRRLVVVGSWVTTVERRELICSALPRYPGRAAVQTAAKDDHPFDLRERDDMATAGGNHRHSV